jgi:Transcriptional regulator containing PAS, AAA-type ATPase, and DNA-binding domains
VIHLEDISFDHVPGCACTQETPEAVRAEQVAMRPALGRQLYGRRSSDRDAGPVAELNRIERRGSASARGEAAGIEDDKLTNLEKQKISRLLAQYGNRRLVASKLGISERTLYRKIKCYGLDTRS